MKNLMYLLLVVVLLISCTKEKEINLDVVNECFECSELALLAIDGNLCTLEGYQVYVIVDTNFVKDVHTQNHMISIAYTEYFYYLSNEVQVWANPWYLVECE